MSAQNDWNLLCQYCGSADHDAFAKLVRKYIGLVYGAALRQTRDAQLADDVTQAVLIVLARKAHTIGHGAVLASWLFTVTRHAAQNAMKMQARQRYHEHRAAAGRVEVVVDSTSSNTDELREVLDEAIARLPEPDRSGVLLHFFQDRPHEEVGAALGISAEAARKRVSRALDKMRTFLTGRGVAIGGGAAVLMAAVRAEAAASAVAVPAGLVDSTVNIALLSAAAQTSAHAGSVAIAHGVTRSLTLAKLKVAAAIVLTCAGVAGAAVVMLPFVGLAQRAVEPVVVTTTLLNAQSPATAPSGPMFTTEVTKDITVEFLGASPFPGDENSWFSIAGEHIELPDHRLIEREIHTDVPPDHQLALKVEKPKEAVVLIFIDNATMASNSMMQTDDDFILLSRFTLGSPSETASIRLGISTKGWETVAVCEDAQKRTEVDAGEHGTITFSPPEPDTRTGGMKVEVFHDNFEVPYRVVAIDDSGQEHQSNEVNVSNSGGNETTSAYTFDLPQEKFAKLQFQVRQIDKWVIARDISLSADHKTQPTITVKDAAEKK